MKKVLHADFLSLKGIIWQAPAPAVLGGNSWLEWNEIEDAPCRRVFTDCTYSIKVSSPTIIQHKTGPRFTRKVHGSPLGSGLLLVILFPFVVISSY